MYWQYSYSCKKPFNNYYVYIPWYIGLVGDFVTINDTPTIDFLYSLYFRATSDMCSYISSANILLTCCLWSCKGAGQGYFKGKAHSPAWTVWSTLSNVVCYFCQISTFISQILKNEI